MIQANKSQHPTEKALSKVESPVFIVTRHGRRRRFLSRSAALNNLVHYMVTGTFDKAGIPTHEPSTPAIVNGVKAEKRGQLTERYLDAHHRTHRRVLKLAARMREIDKWNKKHAALLAVRDELERLKPY